MPSKKSSRVPAPWRRVPAQWRKVILAFAVACVGAAGILMAFHQPSPVETQPRVETSIVEVQARAPAAAQPAPTPRAPRPDTRKPAAAASAARPVNAAAPKPERTETTAKPVAAAAATTGSAPALPSTAAPTAQGDAATITGCLEFDDDRFRLKDTEGEGAPRARSWRSGFLRRSSARVDVLDASDRLRLTSHVGHRVSVTGMLVDRQMEARSLTMVADTCDD